LSAVAVHAALSARIDTDATDVAPTDPRQAAGAWRGNRSRPN